MRMRALVVMLVAGCRGNDVMPPSLSAPHDAGVPTGSSPESPEGAPNDLAIGAGPRDLGVAPGAPDLAHPGSPPDGAPPMPPSNATLTGLDVLDVSVDQGGGVWAVTASKVYYLPPGHATPYSYDQHNGLARGWTSWTDTWFSPGTYPVTFSAVAGATPGQAIVGNMGAIADRLQVDPATGAVERIDNLAVTSAQQPDPTELKAQQQRVVAVWHAVVDLNGTYAGTSYLGGFHGFYAFHGLDGNCGCAPAFEEHEHYITATTVYGDDVRGLAISPMGDVWTGDRDILSLLPQRSTGPYTDFFANNFSALVDVWPSARDEIASIAVDASNGVWVASSANGLAYVAPATLAVSFVATPQPHLTGVAVDGKGAVWVGTASMGVGRLDPATRSWSWVRQANGLPSDDVTAVYFDRWSGGAKIWIATDSGITSIQP